MAEQKNNKQKKKTIKTEKQFVNDDACLSDSAHTEDYIIFEVCAHIKLSELWYYIFIWSVNYCDNESLFHVAGLLDLILVIEKIDLSQRFAMRDFKEMTKILNVTLAKRLFAQNFSVPWLNAIV